MSIVLAHSDKPYLDTYECEPRRTTKCVCGKSLPKGQTAFMAVYEPENLGPFYNHRFVCSPECALTLIAWKEKQGAGSERNPSER